MELIKCMYRLISNIPTALLGKVSMVLLFYLSISLSLLKPRKMGEKFKRDNLQGENTVYLLLFIS